MFWQHKHRNRRVKRVMLMAGFDSVHVLVFMLEACDWGRGDSGVNDICS